MRRLPVLQHDRQEVPNLTMNYRRCATRQACSATAGCADSRVTGLAFAAQALATRFIQNYEKGPTLPNDFLSAVY